MKNKKPAIRFGGFSEEWEEKSIAELGDISTGFTPATDDNSNYGGSYFFVSPADIQENRYIEATNTTLSRKGFNIGRIIKEGSTLFVCIGSTIGKVAQTKRKVTTNQQINAVIPDSSFDNDFVFSLLEHESKVIKQLAATQAVPIINKTNFSNVLISCTPNVDEQTKIGTFFKHLDGLIALHQQQYDKQIIVKKAMLEKMFPKNGATVPEIRFKGFTGDWEEKTLGDGASKIGDGLHGTPQYISDGDVYFINGNNLVSGTIVFNNETKQVSVNQQSKDDKTLNENTILMSINGTIGNLAWYRGESVMLGKSVAYITVDSYDKSFIYTYLQTPFIHNYFINRLTGSTIKNLGLKTIRETELLIPKLREEQKAIGQYFQKLDNLLALHKRELEKLKNIKKALLEKMFV